MPFVRSGRKAERRRNRFEIGNTPVKERDSRREAMRVASIGGWVLLGACGGQVLGAGFDEEGPGPAGAGAGGESVVLVVGGDAGSPQPNACEEHCFDGIANADETDVDCGGACGPCLPTISCIPGDCEAPAVCACGLCLLPDEAERCARRCADGQLHGPETDIDCGGSQCAPCRRGQRCRRGSDCESGLCSSQNPDDPCAGPFVCK